MQLSARVIAGYVSREQRRMLKRSAERRSGHGESRLRDDGSSHAGVQRKPLASTRFVRCTAAACKPLGSDLTSLFVLTGSYNNFVNAQDKAAQMRERAKSRTSKDEPAAKTIRDSWRPPLPYEAAVSGINRCGILIFNTLKLRFYLPRWWLQDS